MNPKMLKGLVLLVAGFITFTIGNKIYMYFTHNQKPHIILEGLVHEHTYKGELNCCAVTNNTYKVDTIAAHLDGKPYPLSNDGSIGSKVASLPLAIDTTKLHDGKHTLALDIIDSSRNKNKNTLKVDFYVDNMPLQAGFLDDKFSVAQGKTLHLKIKANKKLQQARLLLGTKPYPIYQADPSITIYECFIPIDCEELANDIAITAELSDAVCNSITLKNTVSIKEFAFKKQKRTDYSMQKKLDDEKELSNNHQVLETAMQKWLNDSPSQKLWSGPFELPTQAKQIITPHGEVRVTPTRGRYMHKGIDIINNPRSVVWAAQNGKVIIKDRFLLTGNTIVIDHGLGISTLYAHLDDFAEIEVGDAVRKGNPIGKLGKTGYATGYHLHWELRVHGVAVDPLEWTKTIY